MDEHQVRVGQQSIVEVGGAGGVAEQDGETAQAADGHEPVLVALESLLDRMAAWTPPATEKWLDPSER